MKILVACEESQAVTIELRRLGHEAYSCDIEPCSGGHPAWHIRQDVLPLLNGNCTFKTCDGVVHSIAGKWDMLICFPPCTDLANSGAAWFEKKRADGRQQTAIKFFLEFAHADCPRIAIENPVGVMSTYFRKPNQIVHPWQFAKDETENVNKSTCIWIIGDLKPLIPANKMRPDIKYVEWRDKKTGRTKRQETWYYKTRCMPHSERGKMAAKTFPGIARAMAEQWAGRVEVTA